MTALTELADRLANAAEWRRELFDDHPDDARHQQAAATLARLATELPALEGAAAHRRIVAAWAQATGSPLYQKAEDELLRSISFTAHPLSAADFLRALVDRLEQRATVAS